MSSNKPVTQEEKQQAYDAWFIAEVEKGIADADAGNVLTHAEAQREMAEFMASLHQKHGQQAA